MKCLVIWCINVYWVGCNNSTKLLGSPSRRLKYHYHINCNFYASDIYENNNNDDNKNRVLNYSSLQHLRNHSMARAQMPEEFQGPSRDGSQQRVPERPEQLQPVTWMSLPRKCQLIMLCICRIFDFLQIATLQAYVFYQLKSFDERLTDADISTQAGILQGAFTAAQFTTAILWGRIADARWGGRKFVLLVGLIGTAISCLGVAFATTIYQAVFWRFFGGAINGTVGIIRTMIAENVMEKKYHSRAFLILPIGFNIAALFGPGEWTADQPK